MTISLMKQTILCLAEADKKGEQKDLTLFANAIFIYPGQGGIMGFDPLQELIGSDDSVGRSCHHETVVNYE